MKFEDMVTKLAKSGDAILPTMTALKCHALHMAGCVNEEAGEVFGVVKKHIFYEQPLDREKLIKELGDLEFYLEGLRQGFEITRHEVLEANKKKLGERFKNFNYSNQQAHDRADKS
jgi:NTP pyrophosphatase (non-canonical NTP hydrolase)